MHQTFSTPKKPKNANASRRNWPPALLCVFIMSTFAGAVSAADELAIFPAKFTLMGPASAQRLLVQQVRGEKFGAQVTDGITFESSDPNIVRVDKGAAIPVGNGTAILTARVGSQTASAQVTVLLHDKPQDWSFRNQVQSVLSKTGCNSGACHGAASGKNGFKLSLRGYDPKYDYHAITRQLGGRRIVPSDPGRSLLLTKPTAAVAHKGGVRFEVDSLEYRVIAEWLAAGHPGPAADDPRMDRLEILPPQAVLSSGATQQFLVLAHFSDGHTEDVTQWAKYTSTNLSVASVDEVAKLEVTGHGEGAVVAWYLSQNVVGTVTVPHSNQIAGDFLTNADRNNFVDDFVLDKLKSLNIPPSPLTNDTQFVRRVYLDTIGLLPTPKQTQSFLDDPLPEKRTALIDRLLASPEYVDYWTYKWSDLFLVSSARLRPPAVKTYYEWIRQRVEENTPWDDFARQVVTARGSTIDNGAANFFALHDEPLTMAENVSMAFLGMSINCARCHDHPLEKWTNDDYYGMANMFARVRGKGWGGDSGSGDGNRSIFSALEGELIQPRTGRPQPPRPLDAEPIAFTSTEDRRSYLADWLTSPENPYFSRAIVNRVWANFLGVGIVENVDDLRLTNPASNEPLLTSLASDLANNGFDLKKLMRVILNSATYQRSSRSVPGNESDARFYSRYYSKRLKAEVLLDSIVQVTGVPTKFDGYDDGTRAIQLRDASISSYFLETFGRPERILTCECERSDEPSMVQVLHIMNGDTLNSKLAAKDGRITKLLEEKTSPESIIEQAYLSALSRRPTAEEKTQTLAVFSEVSDDDQRLAIEDLYWSVLSSKEFLFNH